MNISSLIGDHTLLIGFTVIALFCLWKFVLEPIMNEGKPIEPSEEDIKTFGEKMQESLKSEVDF